MTGQQITERLQSHRQDILWAELAGYIHVFNRLDPRFPSTKPFVVWRVVKPSSVCPEFYLSDTEFDAWLKKFVGTQTKQKKSGEELRYFLNTAQDVLSVNNQQVLNNIRVALLDEQWPLGDLATLWNAPFTDPQTKMSPVSPFLNQGSCNALLLFQLSHGLTSKLKLPNSASTTGSPKSNRISTVFGWEDPEEKKPKAKKSKESAKQEAEQLIASAGQFAEQRSTFISKWKEITKSWFADDRKPINDISLWEYSRAVAAFFKAAAAKVWIEGKWPDWAKLNWQLLAVGYPGLEFIGQAVRISDTLARKNLIRDRLNVIQHLFEDQLPIGNEIYRDENGSLFLVANIEDLELEHWVKDQAGSCLGGDDDLLPFVKVGYDSNANGLFPVWEAIKNLHQRQALPLTRLQGWWAGKQQIVCPVCGLRPQGTGTAWERSVCDVCLERRRGRCRDWLNKKEAEKTIWIEEASDRHGICALLAGRLDLEGWLEADDTTSYFSALSLDGNGNCKRPDFMRVQSCWETTREFWEAAEKNLVAKTLERYKIPIKDSPGFSPYHVYEATLEGGEISLVWDGHCFITAFSTEYYEEQIQPQGRETLSVLRSAGRLCVRVPHGYKKDDIGRYELRDEAGTWVNIGPAENCGTYRPVIPILAAPRHFLAILPADQVSGACRKIAKHYREQFGKVRAMLPISLGVVFFDRRTPIYAVMQAGQKLLRMPPVKFAARKHDSVHPDERIWAIPESSPALWRPLRLPDEDDDFYARVRLKAGGSKSITKLQPDEQFLYSISQFDFIHLETTGYRYRLGYDNSSGARLDSQAPTRSFSLEGFERMEKTWRELSRTLTTTQINSIFAAVEQKREDWNLHYPIGDAAFRCFAESVVREAEWQHEPQEEQMQEHVNGICAGLFRDAIELHLKILKEEGRKEQENP